MQTSTFGGEEPSEIVLEMLSFPTAPSLFDPDYLMRAGLQSLAAYHNHRHKKNGMVVAMSSLQVL